MPLTADEAAAVAAKHGLTLQDAAGLLGLADDAADAERIASSFAAATADPLLATARDLFGHRPGRRDHERINLATVPLDPEDAA